MKATQTVKSPRVLVIDVGGTNIKLLATGEKEPRKIPSGPTMSAGKKRPDFFVTSSPPH
jgi:hypothetical protein